MTNEPFKQQVPLSGYVQRLQKAGIANPAQEVRLIVSQILKIDDAVLLQSTLQPVLEDNLQKIEAAIKDRESRKPLERILEYIDFSGLRLHVGADIFKPYRETEDALTHAVMLFQHNIEAPLRILDLGTGSGCVLLSLLYALPNATGIGIDNNEAAVLLAQENAAINNLQDRAEFRTGNWSDGIGEKFDLVISNPPRVATDDIKNLVPEMRDYDPKPSLDGGMDGLKYFRLLADDFRTLIKDNSFGFVQLGPRYVLKALQLFRQAGLVNLVVKTNFLGQPCAIIYRHEIRPNFLGRMKRFLQ